MPSSAGDASADVSHFPDRSNQPAEVKITPSSVKSARLPQLDGLRGIAILLVIGLHYLNDAEHGPFGSLLYKFGSAFRLGWSGVDLFFVLSGFLIGNILLEARQSGNFFRTFYIRRFFRIIPLFYLWVASFALATILFGETLNRYLTVDPSTLRLVPWYILFLQNYVSLPFGSLAWYWLAVSWSLGVEEQFYVVSPPLVRWLSTERLRTLLYATVFLAPLLRFVVYLALPNGRNSMYVWMPTRADSLGIGMLTALLWREGRISQWYANNRKGVYLTLVALLVPVPFAIKWYFDQYSLGMGLLGYTWLAALFAFLLVQSIAEPNGRWSRFLQLSPLCHLGRLSYCIYLIHLLVLGLCHRVLRHARPSIGSWKAAAITVFAFAITCILAEISQRVLERPLIAIGHRQRYE